MSVTGSDVSSPSGHRKDDGTGPRNPVPERAPSLPWWLPTGLVSLLVALLARRSVGPISDYDTFWHLRLGEEIVRTRSLTAPTTSWSEFSDQPWVPTQWLTEVVAATAHRWFGLPGVAFLFAAAVLTLVVLLHRLCRGRSGSVPAAFATGLAIVAMSASISPRPHMVTYVFLTITLLAWLRTIDDLRPRWWLVPLSWLWAMSHGMWFTGAALGVAITLGLLADRRLDRRRVGSLLAVPTLSVLAAALTPVGPGLLAAPFAVAGVGDFITEWQPPSFREPAPAAAMMMVVLVVVLWSRRTRPTPWAHLAILTVGLVWILLAARTVTLGALLLAPLAAAALQEAIGRPRDLQTRGERRFIVGSALLCLAAVAVALPSTADEPANMPGSLDSALDTIPEGSVILNSYELGGWLRWRHPELEPVVDGMTEAYSVPYLQDYARASFLSPGWEQVVQEYGARHALLAETSPLAAALTEHAGWTEVDRSRGYLLLRSPG